jgi:DegV family protein with EDD domain
MLRVVTDSTCYIPPELIARYNISLVPLKVQVGRETFNELEVTSNRDFYRQMATSKIFPTTSQPATGEFKKTYQKILNDQPTAEILVLTVSSKLSGTYNAALTAARALPAANITVFDSLSVAMGLGIMVLTAAEMAAQDLSLTRIMARLAQMKREVTIFLFVDNLDYLKRGGRIGAASAFLGTLLKTKPILTIKEGKIEFVAQVRTKEKAIDRLITELERRLSYPDQPVQAGVMHVMANVHMAAVAGTLRDRFNLTRLFTLELGPVIGIHLGPGAVGAGICPEPGED